MARRNSGQAFYLDVRSFDGQLGLTGLRTVAALAQAVGLSRAFLFQVRGGYTPSEEQRQKIAAALHVDPSALWKPVPSVAS